MIWPALIGRVERNGGRATLIDQKSGLLAARPMGSARTSGMITNQLAAVIVKFGEFREIHADGPIAQAMTSSTSAGSTTPLRRHSIQNSAASAEAKERGRGSASLSRATVSRHSAQ